MKNIILQIANRAIEKAVVEKEEWLPDLKNPLFLEMQENQGVFTSLYTSDEETHEKEPRGCVGLPYPIEPLARAVAISAMKSATKDPRFPPVADHELEDNTSRVCVNYARRWGYGSLVIANLFAFRSTDISKLYVVNDPIGPDNDLHLIRLCN